MPLRQQVFAITAALLLLGAIVELVRRRRLREEYSWLWLLTGTTILLVVVWFDLLLWFTQAIGAVVPTNALFIVAIVYLMAIALHFSVKVSSLENRLKELAQRHALLEEEAGDRGKGPLREPGEESRPRH